MYLGLDVQGASFSESKSENVGKEKGIEEMKHAGGENARVETLADLEMHVRVDSAITSERDGSEGDYSAESDEDDELDDDEACDEDDESDYEKECENVRLVTHRVVGGSRSHRRAQRKSICTHRAPRRPDTADACAYSTETLLCPLESDRYCWTEQDAIRACEGFRMCSSIPTSRSRVAQCHYPDTVDVNPLDVDVSDVVAITTCEVSATLNPFPFCISCVICLLVLSS